MPGRRTIEESLKYRSTAEAAAALGLSSRQLRLRIRQGLVKVRHRGTGGRLLFTQSDIEAARRTLRLPHPDA